MWTPEPDVDTHQLPTLQPIMACSFDSKSSTGIATLQHGRHDVELVARCRVTHLWSDMHQACGHPNQTSTLINCRRFNQSWHAHSTQNHRLALPHYNMVDMTSNSSHVAVSHVCGPTCTKHVDTRTRRRHSSTADASTNHGMLIRHKIIACHCYIQHGRHDVELVARCRVTRLWSAMHQACGHPNQTAIPIKIH